MTTNKQQTRADKEWNIFMSVCISCFFLFCYIISAIDCMIIA